MAEKLVIEKKKYQGDNQIISARIPTELVKKIDNLASESGRNRNELLLVLLEFALENVEIK